MPAMTLRRSGLIAGAVALALVALGSAQANAQVILFQGYTNGCFGAGCVPTNSSAYQSALLTGGSLNLLLYQNAAINTNVVSGSTAVLNAPGSALGVQNVNNFGNFIVLTAQNYTFPSSPQTEFNLMLTLTSPTSQSIIFNGLLSGYIQQSGANIQLVFTNTPGNVTWSSNNGSATITVNNLTIAGTTDVFSTSGTITAQVVPEPASMFLLGSGLLGLAGAARRRRKARADAAALA